MLPLKQLMVALKGLLCDPSSLTRTRSALSPDDGHPSLREGITIDDVEFELGEVMPLGRSKVGVRIAIKPIRSPGTHLPGIRYLIS